jgi:hypothetical protein
MNGKRKKILKRKLKEIAEIKVVGLLMELLMIKKMKRKNNNKRNMKSTLIL